MPAKAGIHDLPPRRTPPKTRPMILASTTTGTGPDILLLHGLFGAAKNLGALSRGLAKPARVTALDLRNHGASPHAASMSFADMAADVRETAESLGIRSARIAGHSLGGKVAMVLAVTAGNFVERIAVLDIAPIAYRHSYDSYAAAMAAIPLSQTLTRAAADAALAAVVEAPAMRAFLLNNLSLNPPSWRIGLPEITACLPGLMAWSDPPGATPYSGRTLFLRGGNSDYVPDSALPAIHRLFPAARLETVANASHWLHADQPAATLAALETFLLP
jgi:pimeloyl-ACP methyl ester carboxylesterase